jgi:signal transduction histidine kinase
MRHAEPVSSTVSRTAAPAAAALLGVAAEAAAIAVSDPGSTRWIEVAVGAVVVAYGAVGLLILVRRPGHPIGWTMVAIASVWGVGQLLVAWGYEHLLDDRADRAAAAASQLGGLLRALPWFVAVLWLPVRFPDGAPPDTRLRQVAERLAVLVMVLAAAESLLAPRLSDLRVGDVDSPLGLPDRWAVLTDPLAGAMILLALVSIALAVACLVQRYRAGGALDRQQTILFGLAFVPPVAALGASLSDAAGPWLFALATLPLPVAIGLACLQNRLYDLNLVVNRSLTYGALWVVIAALYALTVGGVGATLQQRGADWLPWVAAGVVAVSFAPLRDALQGGANRLTYGSWSQPAEVLAATGRRLGDASDVRGLLQTLTDELGEGLGLAHVEILDAAGRTLAARGEPAGAVHELVLQAYAERVGVLRWSGRRLRETDRSLLGDVALQLGAVVHAEGLLSQLRAGQERLVLAREEERKRLRRDLHDGLGPALAGLTLQVDTLRNQLAGHADDALLELRSGIQSTVLDVRRIVEGLRPPSLDELGLAGAVRQLATRLGNGTGPVIDLDVQVEEVSAAAEVAAYRIVQEALTNATRHAGARRVRLELRSDCGTLVVRVADDGTGAVRHREGGVGLTSMRERAEQIGGELCLDAAPGGGTTVTARLPIGGRP